MAKALLIVDPQMDFIDGALAVPGAPGAMGNLARYLEKAASSYDIVIITADRHPVDHCSFVDSGGQWPAHCIAGSSGAEILPAILPAIASVPVKILPKGEDRRKEEYSIFMAKAEEMDMLLAAHAIDRIDICGIAGDVCVLNTLRDGLARYGPDKFRVLMDFCASLDDGSKLREFCTQEAVSCIRL